MAERPASVLDDAIVEALAEKASRLYSSVPPNVADALVLAWFKSALEEIEENAYHLWRAEEKEKVDGD